MEISQILVFIFVASLLVVSPGPNGLLIAKTVPVSGKSAGFANIVGFIFAFYLHGLLSVLGISILLTKSEELFLLVKLLGALYLMWLGFKSLQAAFTHQEKQVQASQSKKALTKAFVEGFLTNVLNPKVSMFYLAAFPQFIPMGENAIFYGLSLVSLHVVMNMMWFSLMVLLLSKMTHLTKKYVLQKALKSVTGIIFISFGIKLLSLESK